MTSKQPNVNRRADGDGGGDFIVSALSDFHILERYRDEGIRESVTAVTPKCFINAVGEKGFISYSLHH